MIRAKMWNGKDLKGTWHFTLKIDGVRALRRALKDTISYEPGRGRVTRDKNYTSWKSRGDRYLYNIPWWGSHTDVEVYLAREGSTSLENYKRTIRAVRTQKAGKAEEVLHTDLYSLDPLDPRLELSYIVGQAHDPVVSTDPTAEKINEALAVVLSLGYEGLVLRRVATPREAMAGNWDETWLKVKPEETHDVKVTGAIGGTGKHKGRLGALMTDMGKVGTGFSDAERQALWDQHTASEDDRKLQGYVPLVGETVEVSCMQLTTDGKFRHPRFVRMRPDK